MLRMSQKLGAIRILTVFVLIFVLSACAKACDPEQVAMAVARLTVLNADTALTALVRDRTCGFRSPEVYENAEIYGEVGEEGMFILSVDECEIDFKDGVMVTQDEATETFREAHGVLRFKNVVQTVHGTLTGIEDFPIIPTSDDAITLEVEVEFDHYSVNSELDTTLFWNSGSISGSLSPRLAKNAQTGICSVPTSHRAFWDVTYSSSSVRVHTPDRDIDVDVNSSNLHGQHGQSDIPGEEGFIENQLEGTLRIWDENFSIPVPGDGAGLDPGYDIESLVASDESLDDIAVPISFDCDEPF